jgi:NTP pyrophosphatase (non-canonical NTP hydrolase)
MKMSNSSISIMSRIAYEWALRCFGADHVHNPRMRALRALEEVAELCQAVGCHPDDTSTVLEKVWKRPKGGVHQEVGGSLMTLVVFCEMMGFDMEEELERELRRVLDRPTEEFTKRNLEKVQAR